MRLHTTSEVISLSKQLETDLTGFYRGLADKYPEDKATLLCFIEQNNKYIVQIERAYYGVITDAFEGCFAFDLEPDEYVVQASLEDIMSYDDGINKAIEIEENLIKFYSDASEQAKSLMADIPRAFSAVAKKRAERISLLRSLRKNLS